jgi:cytosine deaminase
MSAGLLLRDATLADGSRADVRVRGERIEAVGRARTLEVGEGEAVLDLSGHVLVPAPVDPHAHLDKAFTADRIATPAPDLWSAIERWHDHRRGLTVEDIAGRAKVAALATLARGATAIRSHVDVGEGIDVRGAEALVAVREELRGLLDVQVVALAYPLAGEEGAENRRRLCAAAELGVDLVGGAAHVTPDPTGDLDVALEIASRYGLGVDLHTDERLEVSHGLEELAQRCSAGFRGPATASHCVSLGMRPPETQASIAAAVAAAGVGVVTCPLTNLLLQGRELPAATPRGLTAIGALMEAGATVAGGGDNVQDVFTPNGGGDPLPPAQLLVAAGQLDVLTAYRLVSDAARRVMGLPEVQIVPGAPAELLAVAGRSLREAIATATEDRIVLRGERVLARTRVERVPAGATAALEVA